MMTGSRRRMQTVRLREGEASRVDTLLTGEQLDVLRRARVDVRPASAPGAPPGTAWELRPSTLVGVFRCGDLNVVVNPRIPIDRVMFLVGYSLGTAGWESPRSRITPDDDILEAIVPAFVRLTQEAIRRGLLQGYRAREESLGTVRGRIRLADQVRERFGMPTPVEVLYDDFTEDIDENRLLKTAINLLLTMPVRSSGARRDLTALWPAFSSVSAESYPGGATPVVQYTRLNRRYQPAVELARLVVGSSSLRFSPGDTVGASLLVDMDRVFETFLRTALRQELRLSETEWPRVPPYGRSLLLEEEGQVRLNPALTWWRGRRCLFVGDARYGWTGPGTGPQEDIYRMLAYCTAADLPSALLVTADGNADPAVHRIRNTGKAIEVASLDLSGSPQDTLERVRAIADRVRAHRDGAAV